MQISLPLFVALIALLLAPGLFFHFDVTPKMVVLLAAAAVSLLYFRKNCAGVRRLAGSKPGFWFLCALLAQLAWTIIATARSSSVELSLYGGEWRRFGLISFAALVVLTIVCTIRTAGFPRRIEAVLRAVACSGAILSIYGVFQYFGLDPFMHSEGYSAGEGPFQIVRPPGTFGHADYFATWLVFVVFAGLALSRLERERWTRVAAMGSSAVAAFAIVLTGTRAALLGVAVGLAVLAAFRTVRLGKAALIAGIGVVVLSAFVLSPWGLRVRARVHWSGDDLHGGARISLWRDSLKMALDRPFLGFGPETFSLRFPQYESADLARAYPDFYHESPHNVLLDEMTAKGIPGLLFFLATVTAAVWPVFRAGREDRRVRSLFAALTALFVCQMFSVFVVGTAVAFYISLAMLVAASAPRINAEAEAESEGDRGAATSLVWLALPSLAISVCFAIYAAKITIGDYRLERVNSSMERKDIDAASGEFARAIAWLPPGPAEDIYFSRQAASLAMQSPMLPTHTTAWREALMHATRAVRTSDARQNAWYSLATMLARANDAEGVERSLRNAIAWAPNWFKPHWTLAEFLALSGRHAEALAHAKLAVELDGGRDAEVSATYRTMSDHPGPPH